LVGCWKAITAGRRMLKAANLGLSHRVVSPIVRRQSVMVAISIRRLLFLPVWLVRVKDKT
jgi:hypothetical protein